MAFLGNLDEENNEQLSSDPKLATSEQVTLSGTLFCKRIIIRHRLTHRARSPIGQH